MNDRKNEDLGNLTLEEFVELKVDTDTLIEKVNEQITKNNNLIEDIDNLILEVEEA